MSDAAIGETPRALGRPSRLASIEPSFLLWIAASLILVVMVAVPLGWLVVASLHNADTNAWTLGNYAEAFSRRIYLQPILNSFILALSVAIIAVTVGTPLAFLVSRTDLPARGLVRALVFAAFVTPEFLGAQAWIFLTAPNSGWLNKWWEALFHTSTGPFNIYTLAGAIFVIGIYSVPYTFTFVSGSLEMMSSEIEDAAAILGSSPLRTLLTITLPLVLPAIVAGFIMSFLEALAVFGAPAFILIPARQQVMTTQLYLFFQYPVRVELAAAYAIPLLLVTIVLLWIQRRLLGRKRFVTVTGKGGRKRAVPLGVWRWPLFALAMVPAVFSVVLPYGVLFATSISRAWGNGLVPGNITGYWYVWALADNPEARNAIVHSLLYAAAGATIAMTVASLIAYAHARKLFAGTNALAFLCTAPFVVPGIVLAIGFFSAYSHPPLVLYGTAWILIIAFATRFLPIAFSNATTSLAGINPELENAARTLGAGRLRTLASVTAPLLRRGVLSGWLLVFVPALRELSCAVFLFTPGTAVMTTVMFDYSDAGNYEAVSTLGILMMVVTFAIVALAYRFVGRDFLQTRDV